jgi:hypothetical protein
MLRTNLLEVSEEEVRHRIEQAFAIAPRMTISMLQAFLNTRIKPELRTHVLVGLEREGKISVERMSLHSLKGYASTATVLCWNDKRVEK